MIPRLELSEQAIQKAVFAHLKSRAVPGAFFWHPFSGGFRKPKEAAIYKGLGAIAGLPDVMVLHQSRLFTLELKREGGKATEIQRDCLAALERAGASTAIAAGLDQAVAKLEEWGLLRMTFALAGQYEPIRGDAREFLRSLPGECAAAAFFDPQHESTLKRLKYGNPGSRQRERHALPAMSDSYIEQCCRDLARGLQPSGYLFVWADAFRLCQGSHLDIADVLPPVALIAWDSGRIGMGYRVRERGDYVLVLQKPPLRAKETWHDHGIPSRWAEKVDRKIHAHVKPIGLIRRLIAAVTTPGDLVVDPAAGGFGVMHAANELGRRFAGVDIMAGVDDFENLKNPRAAVAALPAEAPR